MLPKGVPENINAAEFFPEDLGQDLDQDFRLGGGILDSEEDEDGEYFDGEYEDALVEDEGDAQ